MKVTIEPGALAAAVKFAARSLTARSAYPILGGLKITATPRSAAVCAFDGEVSAQAHLDADTGEPGTILVPGRLLAHICAQLPSQPTDLSTSDNGLTLACGSTRYSLRLLPAADYPALPELAAPAGQIDGAELAAAIGQVSNRRVPRRHLARAVRGSDDLDHRCGEPGGH